MNTTKPLLRVLTTAAAVLLVGAAIPATAEVAVRVDLDGAYRAVHVVAPELDGDVWSVDRRSRDASRLSDPLNPRGDSFGDLFPTVEESPVRPFHPWVVWSRPDGDGHHLLWSRWTADGWAPVEPLVDADPIGSDLDPRLIFDNGGTPVIAWWNAGVDAADDSGARVFVSVFHAEGWTPPIAVSPEGVDARRPELRRGDHGSIEVDFETPQGTLTQFVVLEVPDTITDDINPQYQLLLKGGPHVRGGDSAGGSGGGSGGGSTDERPDSSDLDTSAADADPSRYEKGRTRN